MMRAGEADVLDFARRRKVDESGEREAVDERLEAADAVAQALREHRDDAVGEVDAVAARERLAVEGAAGADIMGDIGDVDAEPPAAGQALDVDGIVEIPGVVGIDGDDEFRRAILAARRRRVDRRSRGCGRPRARTASGNSVGRLLRRMIESMSTPGASARPEHLDDLALGVGLGRYPFLEADDDFIPDGRRPRSAVAVRHDVDIVDEARIVGDDVEEAFRGLRGCRRWCRWRARGC